MSAVLVTDEVALDTVNEKTSSATVTFPDGLKTDELKVNSVAKNSSDLTIDLGHTNSSVLSYFEDYTNASELSGNHCNIPAGDLNITRINDYCILTARFLTIASPIGSFQDFNLPTRFIPSLPWTTRQMMDSNTTSHYLYVAMNSVNAALRVGQTDEAGTLVNFPGSTSLMISICYYL